MLWKYLLVKMMSNMGLFLLKRSMNQLLMVSFLLMILDGMKGSVNGSH